MMTTYDNMNLNCSIRTELESDFGVNTTPYIPRHKTTPLKAIGQTPYWPHCLTNPKQTQVIKTHRSEP